jgi:hypothetical protein
LVSINVRKKILLLVFTNYCWQVSNFSCGILGSWIASRITGMWDQIQVMHDSSVFHGVYDLWVYYQEVKQVWILFGAWVGWIASRTLVTTLGFAYGKLVTTYMDGYGFIWVTIESTIARSLGTFLGKQYIPRLPLEGGWTRLLQSS